jgi:glycosyl transferase family 1
VIIEKGLDKNFIIVGLQEDSFKQPNICSFPSGELEEQFIHSLYANAKALLFPSQYEGFGLPIIEALQFGKPVILFNTELNRELFACLLKDCAENAIFFDYFYELPEILNNIDGFIEKRSLKRLPDSFRSWNDVARDIENVMDELLKEPVNYRKLEERFSCLQAIDHFHSASGSNHETDRSYPAQVFIDTGKGYTETDSLTHWVTADVSHLEFDLRKFQDIRQIRFDPMNVYGVISLKSARLITSDDRFIDLHIRSHNARTKRDRVYLFDTDDSNIEFESPEQGSFKKLIITIHYIVVGQGVYAYLYRHQLGSIAMTETTHALRRWKYRLKNKLLQLLVQIPRRK